MACWIAISVLTAHLLAAQASHSGTQKDSQIVNDFGARVTQYLELRKKEAGAPPKPTRSSEKLANSQEEMGEKVRSARTDAKQGDIFSPEIARYFRNQIQASLNGLQGARIRVSLQRAEPVHNISLRVNDAYPNGVPLQSTPPSLLLNLPRLPKELEYRIVGHDLVLHDIAANLIVDFVPNAIPTS